MLLLDLSRLDREGSLRIEGRIALDDPLWEGSEVRLRDPLRVALRAGESASGEVVVRGSIEGRLAQACRRCLRPVDVGFCEDVTLVFASPDLPSVEGEGDIRLVPAGASEIDLAEPIREEVILAAPSYTVCEPECKGLCPHCGADLNKTTCDCGAAEPDPRWDVLRALKDR